MTVKDPKTAWEQIILSKTVTAIERTTVTPGVHFRLEVLLKGGPKAIISINREEVSSG